MRPLVSLAVVAAMCASPAFGQTRTWNTEWFDVGETDSACVLSSSFEFDGRSDVKLDIIWDGDRASLILSSVGWSAVDGQEYEGFGYDFRNPDASYGSGGKTTGVVINYIDKGFLSVFPVEMLDDFGAAQSLMVYRKIDDAEPVVVTHVNLRGSGAAIASLRRCTDHVLRENAAQARREAEWNYIAPDPFAVATPAAVSDPQSGVIDTIWARPPRPVFPERALERGITTASVSVSCDTSSSAQPTACSILSETPANVGFGREALASLRSARFSPSTIGSGRQTFTIDFANGTGSVAD